MRYRITTPHVNWGRKKAQLVGMEIRSFLAGNGAPRSVWEPVDEDGEDAVPPAELVLHLQCKPCGIHWYWPSFQPCPKCGDRNSVSKREIKRVAAPASVPLGQPMEAA